MAPEETEMRDKGRNSGSRGKQVNLGNIKEEKPTGRSDWLYTGP